MSANFYQSIVENCPIGCVQYKIIYGSSLKVEDYEFIAANKKFLEEIDEEEDNLIGRRISDVFKGQSNWLDFYQSIQNNLEDTELKYYFEASDKYYQINIQYPESGYMVIFARDITEETKQTENYELFAENTTTQIWHLQDPYTYGKTNKAHADFLGLDKEAMEFEKITNFLAPEEAEMCIAVNKEVFQGKGKIETKEWLTNAKGERKLARVLKNPKFNQSGEIEFVSCSAEDITEEYKLQKEKEIKEDILFAMIHFTEELLTNEHHYDALSNSIELIGAAAQVDRVYYWENHYDEQQDEWFTSQKFEWCLHGVTQQVDNPNLQNNSFESVGDFVGVLAQNKAFITHIRDMEDTITKDILESQEILSILVLPVFVDNHFEGFIGFDSCRFEREWTEVEVSLLKSFVLLYEKAVEKNYMEKYLLQVKENFDNFFNMIDDFLLVFDQKGIIINANETVLKELGYSRDEVIGKSASKIHPEEKSEIAVERMNAIKSGSLNNFSAGARKKDGTIIPIETHVSKGIWDGEDVFFAVSKDITDLTMSEEKFSKAFNLSGTGMIISTIQEGEFIEVNDAFLELIGYEREEVIGSKIDKENIFRSLNPDGNTREKIIDEIDRNNRLYNYEIEIISKDNLVKTAMCNIVSVYINNELYFLTSIVDVTESKLLTEELAQAKKESDIANEAKSQFLSHISHEIRTPMNAVIGYSNLLTSTMMTPKQERYIEGIKASTAMLMSIINDILDWSKIDTEDIKLEIKKFNIDDVIKNVVDQQRFKQAKNPRNNVEIIIEKDEAIPDVLYGDYLRLQQVLLNLLSNAVKFTEIGEIRIQVNLVKKETDKITLAFSVSDTGIGIAKEVIPNIFEPFRQADSSITSTHGGTGLGLAICQKIVTLMNGEIDVKSKLNEGSTFYFTGEFDVDGANESFHSEINQILYKDTQICSFDKLIKSQVLVVDDNQINQDVLKEILEEIGVVVTLASSGEEAIEAAKNKWFDIVLMDLRMPEMDGYETTEKIREVEGYEKLPIIAVSASVSPEEMKRSRKSGIQEFITKPIEKEKLFTAMSKLILKESINDDIIEQISENVIETETTSEVDYQISGINTEEAISRLNNNEELFLRILKRFKQNNEHVVSEINKALFYGDVDLASRLAHTVKGVSGELSAKTVHSISGEIESKLMNGSLDVNKQLKQLEQELTKMFASEIFVEQETESKNTTKMRELNIEVITPLLREISTLLLESNPDGISYIKEIEKTAKNTVISEKITEMKEYSEQYDFESALGVLDEIYQLINKKEFV